MFRILRTAGVIRSATTTATTSTTATSVSAARFFSASAPTSNLFATYVSKLRENVKEVSVDDVAAALKAGPKPTFHLFDVRETTEWNEGRIPQAFYTGRGNLERDIEHYAPDVFDDIVLYCAGGVRSIIAADALQRMGYKNVSSLVGGYGAWKSAGKEIVVPRGKTYSDREEY